MRSLRSIASILVLLVTMTGCNATADQVAVPDVTGLDEAQAVQVLEEAGFVVAAAVAEGSVLRPGTVVEQDPEPGRRAAAGSTVTLKVAREG
jgi:eukaryotic-like serine/threonine-protein kinase